MVSACVDAAIVLRRIHQDLGSQMLHQRMGEGLQGLLPGRTRRRCDDPLELEGVVDPPSYEALEELGALVLQPLQARKDGTRVKRLTGEKTTLTEGQLRERMF